MAISDATSSNGKFSSVAIRLFLYLSLVMFTEGAAINIRVDRPESPWLPGTRKVDLEADPVELTSYVSMPRGDSETYIKVKQMSASWGSEDKKTVLKGISFELEKVCH